MVYLKHTLIKLIKPLREDKVKEMVCIKSERNNSVAHKGNNP